MQPAARNSVVRFLLAVIAVVVFFPPAGDNPRVRIEAERAGLGGGRLTSGDLVYDQPGLGLSVVVPPRWKIVHEPMFACTDPVQRIALRRGAAVVQIVESLSGSVNGFPERPNAFALTGNPQLLACCPPSDGKGWFLPFRDRGRGFYTYVYAGAPETRSDALRILDSFRVAPGASSVRGVLREDRTGVGRRRGRPAGRARPPASA